MSSPYQVRPLAIIPALGATDLSAKKGALVTLSVVSGNLTATLSASASVKAKGVVLEGAAAALQSSIACLAGFSGSLKMKLGGTVTAGDYVQQNSDETVVTDAGSGARVLVGLALESGVSGDLVEVAPCPPITLS